MVPLVQSVFTVALSLAFATSVRAESLYAATSAGGFGTLYEINPQDGTMVRDIGPLSDVQGINYPVTGLAFNPLTGDLFGSTGGRDVVTGSRLIRIDVRTGFVAVIGAFNVTVQGNLVRMTDLAFDSEGNLYGVDSAEARLYSIDLTTAQGTVITASRVASTIGGALAISPAGEFFGIPDQQTIGMYDKRTGEFTATGSPMHFVNSAGYGAMAFDSAGVLFGIDLGVSAEGNPAVLVKIDPATNSFENLGPSVPRLDAIAFQVPEPHSIKLCGIAVMLSFASWRGSGTARQKIPSQAA